MVVASTPDRCIESPAAFIVEPVHSALANPINFFKLCKISSGDCSILPSGNSSVFIPAVPCQ